MNVIAVVLRVVVLNEERRALDPVVMLLAALGLAGPGEADLIDAGLLQAGQSIGRNVRCHEAGAEVDQHHTHAAWRASSDGGSARAAASSAPRIRRPAFGPLRTSAGFDPKNDGVPATRVPFTTVKCSEMGC